MGMTNDGLSYWQTDSAGEPLLEMAIGDLLDRQATTFPEREAVVYSCYPQAVAKGLLALGLSRGAHIAVWAANVPEWLLIQMAAAKAGLVLVTMNPLLRGAELEYILRQGDIQALFFMATIRDHDCVASIRALTTAGTKNGVVSGERLPKLRYVNLTTIRCASGKLRSLPSIQR
jgi:acyl-CoA synthetase (AMP-forming)/AMP-acid ligase II